MQRATRKSSKARTTTRPQHPVPAVRKTPQTLEAIKAVARAEAMEALVAQLSQPRPKSAEQLEAERIEREGFTLQIDRLRQARYTVEGIAYAVQSIHYLAGEADCTRDVQQRSHVLTGMQHSAVVVAQLCDLLAQILGDRPLQLFADHFAPKSEEPNHA